MATDEPVTRPGRQALLWVGESGRLLLGFVLLALLARTVTADVLGTYLSLISVAVIAPRLLDLGLPHALGYFLRVEPCGLRSCALMLARHVALAAPVALGIAYGLRFIPFANDSVTQLTQDHWLRLALFMVSELAILLGLSCLIPTGRFRAHLLTTLCPPLLFIGCVLLRPGPSLSAGQLLDLLLVASLAGSLAMMLALALATRGPARLQFPVAQAYSYGARTFGAAISKIAAQRFDRLFLVTVLGTAGYAQYSLAISIRDMAIFPANLHAMTLRNRQIDLVTRGDDLSGARKVLLRASIAWLALGIVGAVVMFALWPPLVRVGFGTGFPQTADFLGIVAFSCAPMAIMGFAWNHLYAMKLPGRVTFLTCASLLLAIPTFLFFIEWRGATAGVAIAVVVWSALTAGISLAWALASRLPVSKGRSTP